MHRYHAPIDPDCPGAWKEVYEPLQTMIDDPMTEAMGAPVDEFEEALERKHRVSCERCRQYGAANIEVV